MADSSLFSGEIILSNEFTEKSNAFDYCILYTFAGGIMGAISTIILSYFGLLDFSWQTTPLPGLICGSVIGAIIGCIFDFFRFQNHPYCYSLTISATQLDCAQLLKFLRNRGASGSFIWACRKKK